MKKMILTILTISSLLLISIIGLSFNTPQNEANPSTIYVDDSNISGPWNGTQMYPYQNITSGLAQASTGDTIFVYNGTYLEHLILNKSVSLIGEDKHATVIDGNKTGDVIRITASNVSITEFTIQNSGPTSGLSGIFIPTSSTIINITKNIIKNNYNGIRLDYCTNNTLTNNIISNNYYGILLTASDNNLITQNNISSNNSTGIRVSSSNNVAILENSISNNDFGIVLLASKNNNVTQNNISPDNRHGIYLFNSSENTFSKNNISSNTDFGIWVSKSNKNTLTDNNIFSNDMSGIHMNNSTKNTITRNNIFTNNQHGIELDNSNNNILSGNNISKNLVRGTLLYYSNNNTILHNNFINNTGSLTSINSTNTLDNGAEGNYWSDYNGTDTDQDGIGNTPYTIDENNQDNYPLIGTFSDFTVIYDKTTHHVFTICNSTISQFQFNETLRMLKFNVTGPNNTTGFCRVMIPERLIDSPHIVLIDQEEVNATLLPISNSTHAYLYFTYNHSTTEVKILSKPYYELLEKYITLLENYHNLNSTYYELKDEFKNLNQTYLNLNQTYWDLIGDYRNLNDTYWNLKDDYKYLNETHSQLNQTFWQCFQMNLTTENLASLNQTYWELQQNYTELLVDYDSLNKTHWQLNQTFWQCFQMNLTTENLASLNQTYWELQQNYTELLVDYDSLLEKHNLLNQTYQQTLANYTELLTKHDSLNQTYQELTANNTKLQNDYNSLQTNHNDLLEQYNSLNTTYNKTESEYTNTRTTLWIVSVAAATATIITSSLTIKYQRKSNKQNNLIEKYKTELKRISRLDIARREFEADVQRRKEKIEKFEKKYGATVQTRDTLEDVIRSLVRKEKTEED